MSKIRVNSKTRERIIGAFKYHCLEAIQKGYELMIFEKRYQTEWEEDNLTICLVETIKRTDFLGLYQISVNYQPPIYDEAMAFEGANSLRAPRVDFKFSKFFGPVEYDYYAEAKNLSESDWIKPSSASKVSASHYRARYIDTGIENFLSGRYPEGFLVAYIVNGLEENIIAGLNGLINSRKATPRIGIILKDSLMPICYLSENQLEKGSFLLRHLILQLA